MSKQLSQARWRNQPANADYFKGPSHVERVRRWRAAHPGYWKRPKKDPSQQSAAQNIPQPVDSQPTDSVPAADALQDSCRAPLQDSWAPYPPVLVGLIALQMGDALQEDIRRHLDRVRDQGLAILRQGAGAGRFP